MFGDGVWIGVICDMLIMGNIWLVVIGTWA